MARGGWIGRVRAVMSFASGERRVEIQAARDGCHWREIREVLPIVPRQAGKQGPPFGEQDVQGGCDREVQSGEGRWVRCRVVFKWEVPPRFSVGGGDVQRPHTALAAGVV